MTQQPFDPTAIDRLIHEPVRLGIMTILAAGYVADFTFLRETLRVSDGNLATHLRQLEEAGYVTVTKEFLGRKPRTSYQATEAGQKAYQQYLETMASLLPAPTVAGKPSDRR